MVKEKEIQDKEKLSKSTKKGSKNRLRIFRIIISVICFSLITFFFLDFSGLLPNTFHILAHFQFIPALIALGSGISILILLSLLVLTLLFGRIYCSSLCPMGIYQDIVGWISKKTARKKKRYKFKKAQNILRWSIVALTILTFFSGFSLFIGLLDPYSAYGRMATHLFKPIYAAGNNVLASVFNHFGNYSFYKVDISILSISSFIIALLTLFSIGFLAWKYGRTYCNTICPVGTLLGFLSKYSIFKIQIDAEKCNHCGSCATKCKAYCIDSKAQTIDYSRCVDCFNCLDSCSRNALKFAPNKALSKKQETPADLKKRQFLTTVLFTGVTAPQVFAKKKHAELSNKGNHVRQIPISPPGAISAEHLQKHCTSCHLCISKCPSNVIKPAFLEYGIGGMMQPMMFYEKGFCNYNCTICTDVCPNAALKPLTIEEKRLTQIGKVVFIEEICVVHTNETNCGACAEHCPTQAVKMIPYKGELTIPKITTEICIGCGGCEFICPVRPHRAIFIEGNPVHLAALPFEDEEKTEVVIDDFGF